MQPKLFCKHKHVWCTSHCLETYPMFSAISPRALQVSSFSSKYAFSTLNLSTWERVPREWTRPHHDNCRGIKLMSLCTLGAYIIKMITEISQEDYCMILNNKIDWYSKSYTVIPHWVDVKGIWKRSYLFMPRRKYPMYPSIPSLSSRLSVISCSSSSSPSSKSKNGISEEV